MVWLSTHGTYYETMALCDCCTHVQMDAGEVEGDMV